jgi:hypothetical protein
VGLLTGVLSLAREPVRLTLRVWELGLSSAASVARLGLELLGEERRGTPAEPYPPPPAATVRGNGGVPDVADVAPADSARAESPPAESPPAESPPADSPPAVPDELIPDHVDEEVVLVAEVAEVGAEEGAGPELRVDEPWEGYDRMAAVEICDRLTAATTELAAAVELYESTRKRRRSVLDAAARALKT